MGLRGQLNDVGSDSIPLYLVAVIAASLSHIRSLLNTFLRGTTHHDGGGADYYSGVTSSISAGLAGLIFLSEQLTLNRDLSYSYYDSHDDSHSCSECVVCLSSLKERDRVRMLPCRHVFHTDCLQRWIQLMNFNCPLCRRRSSSSVVGGCDEERRRRETETRVGNDAMSWFAAVQ